MLLSIIIPVYNGADRIARCLNSIWEQGLDEDDYEVICVNDCSSDRTVEVLQQIQQQHPNLKVLTNDENLRAGGSRNRGVREASGEYVLFIDADDYFEKMSLNKMVIYLRENLYLDILMIGFAREIENHPNDKLVHHCKNTTVLNGFDFLKENMIPFGPCQYVFKRSLMVDNHIYFAEKVQCEDVDWSHKLAFVANKMQFLPLLVSHMVLNDLSQTATEHTSLNSVAAKLQAGYRLYQMKEDYKNHYFVINYLQSISSLYIKEGLKYMLAIYSPVKSKSEIIKQFIPDERAYGICIKFIRSNASMYALISNLSAPFIKKLIGLKRKYKGR